MRCHILDNKRAAAGSRLLLLSGCSREWLGSVQACIGAEAWQFLMCCF